MEEQRQDTDYEYEGKEGAHHWGFWPTIGFSTIIAIAYFIVQVIVVIAFTIPAIMNNPKLDVNQFAESLVNNGLCLIISTCASAPLTIGLIVLFIKIRKNITFKQYLGLYNPGWKNILKWCAILVIFGIFCDTLSLLIKSPIVPEFMINTYESANIPLLFIFTIVILSPLAEELFFRGFLFEGIRHSRAGAVGAIVLTSLVWSTMHMQYSLFGISIVFTGGLLLGYTKVKTNSIYPAIAMHMLQNTISTIQVIVYLRFFSDIG